MITKTLTSLLLIFVLMSSSLEVYSADLSAGSIKEFTTLHQQLKTGAGSMDLLIKKGPQLVEQTRVFLHQGRNSQWINSPEAQELKKEHHMLMNFLAIKNAFEKCIEDKNAKRNLDKRVLDSAFQALGQSNEVFIPCQKLLEKNFTPLNLNNVTRDLLSISQKIVKDEFTKKLSEQVITNNAKSLLGYKLKFDPQFIYPHPQIDNQLNQIVDQVCLKRNYQPRKSLPPDDVCSSHISPQFKKQLISKLKNELPQLAPKEKFTPTSATQQINLAVDRLNQSLAKIDVKTDKGIIFDSAKLEDDNVKNNFDQYMNQYMHEVQQNAGALLLTSELKKAVGEIKSLDEDDTTKDHKTKKFIFKPHKKAKTYEVANAIKEIERKMDEHNQRTLTLAMTPPKDRDESLAKMVKSNPFAAGPMLLNHPHLTSQMCDTINEVNKDDKFDEDLDKYFTVGAAVLGGAILLTGVGTVAGAYLLTGSVTAGVSAGTVGGTILGYTALAGGAVELAVAGQSSIKAYQQHREMIEQEASFLTNNGDRQNITDAKQALIEYKDARFTAGLSLLGVGLSGASAGKLFNLLKFNSGKVSPDEVKAASKILTYLANTQTAKRFKDVIQALGANGAEKMDLFLANLAKVSEKNRIKLLEKIKDSSFATDKIKKIVEDALTAAKTCKIS